VGMIWIRPSPFPIGSSAKLVVSEQKNKTPIKHREGGDIHNFFEMDRRSPWQGRADIRELLFTGRGRVSRVGTAMNLPMSLNPETRIGRSSDPTEYAKQPHLPHPARLDLNSTPYDSLGLVRQAKCVNQV
jgi:hypothetical protein